MLTLKPLNKTCVEEHFLILFFPNLVRFPRAAINLLFVDVTVSGFCLPESTLNFSRFWHHMHGYDISDLNVYTKEVATRRTKTVSHLTGPWSTEGTLHLRSFGGSEAWWNTNEIEISSSVPIQVRIKFRACLLLNYEVQPSLTLEQNYAMQFEVKISCL